MTTWFVSERQNFSKDVRFDWLSLKQFPRCALSFASCVHSLSLPSSLHSFRPYSLDDYAPLHNIIVYLALSTMKQRQRSALEFVSRSGDNGESIVRIMYQVNSLGFLPKSWRGSFRCHRFLFFFFFFKLELVIFSYHADRENNFGELLNVSLPSLIPPV